MSGIKNPEGAKAYLIKHGMHQFFEQLANKLLTEQPEDPLAFVEAEVPAMTAEWRDKAAAKQKEEDEAAAAKKKADDDDAAAKEDAEKKDEEPAAAEPEKEKKNDDDEPAAATTSEEENKDAEPTAAADAADDKKKTDAELVTESWGWVKPADGDLKPVGKLFYETLFEQSPGLLDTVFKGTDREAQAGKLMSMIDAAVGLLGNTDKLVPVLNDLGERHAGYGVEDEHYPVVAKALLATLEKGLGDKLTEAHKTAWANIYGVLEGEMKKGAATEKGQRLAADYKARQEKAAATEPEKEEKPAAAEAPATLSEDEAALRIQRTQRQRAAKAEADQRRTQ